MASLSLAAGVILASVMLAALTPRAARAGDARFTVIASPSVPLDNLTEAQLRQVFRLERRYWKAGQPVVLILPPNGSAARAFALGHVVRANEATLRRMLLEKMYRGDIDLAPKVAASDAEAVALAGSVRGLIAIVSSETVLGAAVKVLRIDGHLPRDAGYPLLP